MTSQDAKTDYSAYLIPYQGAHGSDFAKGLIAMWAVEQLSFQRIFPAFSHVLWLCYFPSPVRGYSP
jgi:hypothetical protein